MTIHLITTCSRSKTVPPQISFPYHLADIEAAYTRWRSLIDLQLASDVQTVQTFELYCGEHWSRALSAASVPEVELWAISAGLGLRHSTDSAIAYEATFHLMPHTLPEIWEYLTTTPPAPGRCSSLTELMKKNPNDKFMVAGSPVYVKAVELDIYKGLQQTNADLTIVTSKGYKGRLSPHVKSSHSGLLGRLSSNMNCLNISYARDLIALELTGNHYK